MLESLRVKNYRVFKDLKIDGLHRINLIAGKNNSGKTSLLEAMFLLSGGGNPQVVMNTNVIRGSVPASGVTPQSVETVWKHLFHDLDMTQCIQIEGHHTSLGQMRLSIEVDRSEATYAPLDTTGGASVTDIPDRHSLTFEYVRSDNHVSRSSIRLAPGGLDMQRSNSDVPFNARIILSRSGNGSEDATLLGRLRVQKRGDAVLRALQVIEPKLRNVEDSVANGVPLIWGDIGLSEMVPLHVMGEGMSRLARLVLGIASTPGGVVLMDEIENGIHHSVQVDVWRVIDNAAEEFDTQVFATTHSYECFEHAHKGLGAEGFRLFRLESKNGSNRVVSYDSELMDSAIRHYMEVR